MLDPSQQTLQLSPQLMQLANQGALAAWNSNDPLVPLVAPAGPQHGDPIAYGMPEGDVFPWNPYAAILVGVVRLFSREDVLAFKKAKSAQALQTPAGVADHLQAIVQKSYGEIQAKNAFGPTVEVMAGARSESTRLTQERQQMLNAFRVA